MTRGESNNESLGRLAHAKRPFLYSYYPNRYALQRMLKNEDTKN